ncbi:hypothetical protein PDESU_04135 [Pontiella desulfatans]|uniref:Lipocalin-like domain-containing protein n=1 Tax=Pontiella desulfatans TaxID=2750659 RepID=A0A6C2U6A6_PONDE|nr:hypothetical protein [Pontiella desulfatans]VGO15550.1 hypothetical protein PDESU_04135 [Pontiella desulfatans]
MKTERNWLKFARRTATLALIVCCTMALTSCNDDDGGGGGDGSTVVGTYELTRLQAGSYDISFPTAEGYYERFTFFSDGSCDVETNYSTLSTTDASGNVTSLEFEAEGIIKFNVDYQRSGDTLTFPGLTDHSYSLSGSTMTMVDEDGWIYTYSKK